MLVSPASIRRASRGVVLSVPAGPVGLGPTRAVPSHNCSPSVATPTAILQKELMQSLRHAPHSLGPLDQPGRRTSIAVFSLRGDIIPAVVSLLLLLAGDIELNPGPSCNPCRKPIRRGMDYLRCQANACTSGLHKQLRLPQASDHTSKRLPPVADDQLMEMSRIRGPGTPHRAQTTSTICDSCQQLLRAGIRPLTCATADCTRLVQSTRRCGGLCARQGRWLCRQHR